MTDVVQPAQRHGSFTVAEWCVYRRMSRAMLYKLWKTGTGPKFYQIGARRYISSESDSEWLRQREAQS
jgi:predicted DNA-binding transcriptional regulator AlpA